MSIERTLSVTLLFAGAVTFSVIAIGTLASFAFGDIALNWSQPDRIFAVVATLVEFTIGWYLFSATLNEIQGSSSKPFWIAMGLICVLVLCVFCESVFHASTSALWELNAFMFVELAVQSLILFALCSLWFAFPVWRRRHEIPSAFTISPIPKRRSKRRNVYEESFPT